MSVHFYIFLKGPGSFNKKDISPEERKLFCMAGATRYNDRGEIYKFMLRNMKDDHRFAVVNKICISILGTII